MPFSHLPPGLSAHEKKFMRVRLDPGSARAFFERIELEKYNLSRVLASLGRSSYDVKLGAQLKARIRLIGCERRIALSVLKGKNIKSAIIGVPFRPEKRVVRGVVVFGRDIVSSGARRFIYAAHDLEPSFLSRLNRIAVVIVSRGAMCSHAAALCAEFNTPLLVETQNLRLLATGKKAAVDLSSGKVTLEG
jgi:phosphohistidine swiveling domain-containing protein